MNSLLFHFLDCRHEAIKFPSKLKPINFQIFSFLLVSLLNCSSNCSIRRKTNLETLPIRSRTRASCNRQWWNKFEQKTQRQLRQSKQRQCSSAIIKFKKKNDIADKSRVAPWGSSIRYYWKWGSFFFAIIILLFKGSSLQMSSYHYRSVLFTFRLVII